MSALALKSAVLGAAGCDEVEGHVGRAAYVFVRKRPGGAFVASTHHTLADKVRPPDHKDEQDDGNDRPDGVGPGVGDATGGGRHILYTQREERKCL